MKKIEVKENEGRLDTYLLTTLDMSRSKIQKMIEKENILVNGKSVKNSYSLKVGDVITVEEWVEEPIHVVAENLPIHIVYEDDDVLVVDKENGMVVHPGAGNTSGTLVNALLYHSQLSDLGGEFRPGIVHRIDAYTTGLLMVAKNNKAHEFLSKQLEEKTAHRKYIALVCGVLQADTGTIDAPIGRDEKDRKKMAITSHNSKKAITHFKVLERYKDATLIEVVLETGRTHQIRVHMNYIGHPVVNDPVYGRRKKIDETGQCLHAAELGFVHPTTLQYMEFKSPLPSSFVHILDMYKKMGK